MVDRYGVPGTFPISPPTGPTASSLYLTFKAKAHAFKTKLAKSRHVWCSVIFSKLAQPQ